MSVKPEEPQSLSSGVDEGVHLAYRGGDSTVVPTLPDGCTVDQGGVQGMVVRRAAWPCTGEVEAAKTDQALGDRVAWHSATSTVTSSTSSPAEPRRRCPRGGCSSTHQTDWGHRRRTPRRFGRRPIVILDPLARRSKNCSADNVELIDGGCDRPLERPPHRVGLSVVRESGTVFQGGAFDRHAHESDSHALTGPVLREVLQNPRCLTPSYDEGDQSPALRNLCRTASYGTAANPTTGTTRRTPPTEPRNAASPNENTPPSEPASQ
jgi:hypothetical protein